MKGAEKGGERFEFRDYIAPDAEEYLKTLRAKGVKV